MPRKSKLGEAAIEIKKGFLQKHLGEVIHLIERWLNELRAPYDEHSWKTAYKPTVETDADQNHILRKHLRSRALWQHHSEWERCLGKLSSLAQEAYEYAGEKIKQSHSQQKHYNDGDRNYFLETAIKTAFNLALYWALKEKGSLSDMSNYGLFKEVKRDRYHLVSEGILYYDHDPIATSIQQTEEKSMVVMEHWGLIYELADLKQTKEAIKLWMQIKEIEEKIRRLVMNALKSSDILYPCRFCRHLWK
jgi:hypothetical protein